MCDGGFTIGAIIMGAVGAVKIGTDVAAGEVEKDANRQAVDAQIKEIDFEQGRARRNERLAMMQRSDILQQGAVAAGQARTAGRRAAEDAKAQAGASGVSLTEGSLPNLFALSRANADVDSMTIKSSAARQAWGFASEAEQHAETREMLRERKAYARRAGVLGNLGVDLRTAGSVSGTTGQTFQSIYGSRGG